MFKSLHMKLIYLNIVAILLLCQFANAHQLQEILDSSMCAKNTDTLSQKYSGVQYNGKWRVSFYTALSKYPELQNVKIQFKYQNINTTMQCRPAFFAVFKRPEKRRFVMVFNQNRGKSRGVPLQKLTFNARVGLFAHELAHIVDYLHMHTGQIVWFGLQYLTRKGKVRIEHRIDRMVVWKGMGTQIYCFATEVLQSSNITVDYRQKRRHIYLQPGEIKALKQIVENNPVNVKR